MAELLCPRDWGRCKKRKCALYDAKAKQCAILTMANSLKTIGGASAIAALIDPNERR